MQQNAQNTVVNKGNTTSNILNTDLNKEEREKQAAVKNSLELLKARQHQEEELEQLKQEELSRLKKEQEELMRMKVKQEEEEEDKRRQARLEQEEYLKKQKEEQQKLQAQIDQLRKVEKGEKSGSLSNQTVAAPIKTDSTIKQEQQHGSEDGKAQELLQADFWFDSSSPIQTSSKQSDTNSTSNSKEQAMPTQGDAHFDASFDFFAPSSETNTILDDPHQVTSSKSQKKGGNSKSKKAKSATKKGTATSQSPPTAPQKMGDIVKSDLTIEFERKANQKRKQGSKTESKAEQSKMASQEKPSLSSTTTSQKIQTLTVPASEGSPKTIRSLFITSLPFFDAAKNHAQFLSCCANPDDERCDPMKVKACWISMAKQSGREISMKQFSALWRFCDKDAKGKLTEEQFILGTFIIPHFDLFDPNNELSNRTMLLESIKEAVSDASQCSSLSGAGAPIASQSSEKQKSPEKRQAVAAPDKESESPSHRDPSASAKTMLRPLPAISSKSSVKMTTSATLSRHLEPNQQQIAQSTKMERAEQTEPEEDAKQLEQTEQKIEYAKPLPTVPSQADCNKNVKSAYCKTLPPLPQRDRQGAVEQPSQNENEERQDVQSSEQMGEEAKNVQLSQKAHKELSDVQTMAHAPTFGKRGEHPRHQRPAMTLPPGASRSGLLSHNASLTMLRKKRANKTIVFEPPPDLTLPDLPSLPKPKVEAAPSNGESTAARTSTAAENAQSEVPHTSGNFSLPPSEFVDSSDDEDSDEGSDSEVMRTFRDTLPRDKLKLLCTFKTLSELSMQLTVLPTLGFTEDEIKAVQRKVDPSFHELSPEEQRRDDAARVIQSFWRRNFLEVGSRRRELAEELADVQKKYVAFLRQGEEVLTALAKSSEAKGVPFTVLVYKKIVGNYFSLLSEEQRLTETLSEMTDKWSVKRQISPLFTDKVIGEYEAYLGNLPDALNMLAASSKTKAMAQFCKETKKPVGDLHYYLEDPEGHLKKIAEILDGMSDIANDDESARLAGIVDRLDLIIDRFESKRADSETRFEMKGKLNELISEGRIPKELVNATTILLFSDSAFRINSKGEVRVCSVTVLGLFMVVAISEKKGYVVKDKVVTSRATCRSMIEGESMIVTFFYRRFILYCLLFC